MTHQSLQDEYKQAAPKGTQPPPPEPPGVGCLAGLIVALGRVWARLTKR